MDLNAFEQALLGHSGDSRQTNSRPAADRKTLQLCRQVERALALALAGECGDDLLRELSVESVQPMGSAAQLLVRVRVPASIGVPFFQVMERLDGHSSRLRHVVAQSICRKRTPTLTFVPAAADPTPSPADRQEEGGGHG